jgi:hypothetical protein
MTTSAANGNAQKVLAACGQFLGRIPVGGLAQATGLTTRQVSEALDTLVHHGLFTRTVVGYGRLTPAGFAALIEPPNLSHGPKGPHSNTQEGVSARSRIWRALRVLRKGSVPELLTLASRGEELDASDAKRFLNALVQSGHLRRLQLGEANGIGTPHTRYLLVRDTGPLTPRFNKRERQVIDPNTGVVHALA